MFNWSTAIIATLLGSIVSYLLYLAGVFGSFDVGNILAVAIGAFGYCLYRYKKTKAS